MKNKLKIPLSIAILSILAYSNQGISSLPQQCLYYLTRESWHLNAATIGLISWVVGLAWYIKILWGYIADKVQDTKKCLIISYLSMLAVYAFIITFGLNLVTLIITGLLINICIGFADTNVDKQMVIAEKKHNLKGRLQAIQWTALGVGGLIVALGGAYIAKYFDYKLAYGLAGIIPICMLIYLFKYYKNKNIIKKKVSNITINIKKIFYNTLHVGLVIVAIILVHKLTNINYTWTIYNFHIFYKLLLISIIPIFIIISSIIYWIYKLIASSKDGLKKIKSPRLIVGLIFIACLNFCPSFGTALMIKLRETMGVDKLFLGYLGAMGTVLGIVGYLIYYKFAYKFPMKKLLYFMVAFAGITNLFYLYIPNQWFLVGYNLAFGAFGGITFMTLLAFFVTIIPTGSEGLFYALVTSVSNFTARGGNYFGGLIYDKIGYNANVIISSGLTLCCIFMIPFLKIGAVENS